MELMLIALLVIATVPWNLDAFNVDTSKAQIFSPPSGYKGSYFGYSVALHSYSTDKWLLVGAPLSNVSDLASSSSSLSLKNYGAIFKCKVPSSSPSCIYIPIDNTANEKRQGRLNNQPTQLEMETKQNQWLGAVLESTGKNGKVVTCAPRYAYRGEPPQDSSTFQYKWILGRCFEVETSLIRAKSTIIEPCLDKKKGNNYYGYCQSGFSAKITADKEPYIAMGAVGVSRWKGGVITYSPAFKTTTLSTQDQIDHGNYMGYSVTSGYFGLANKTGIAGGAPRAENIKGKVLIYQIEGQLTVSAALPQPKNIKMGSYFGSVLCSVDLNKDGYTDMLVGAPLYSDVGDEGRVFVYMNNKRGALNLMPDMDLTGDKVAEGRFGSSIASVGDLNKDGFEDVAIGAPYEGSGAVYIYHGTMTGIDPKHKQKIMGSEVQSSLSQFGQSITGGLDVDDNSYPDIAVGAFGSDQVVLFLTQEVLNVEAEVKLNVQRIVLENNETTCSESDNTLHKCLNVTVCFRNLETQRTDLNISYKVELDRDKGSDALKRMYFYKNDQKSFVASRQRLMPFKSQERVCLSPYTVHLREKDRIVDLLSVLTFDLSFDLADTPCGKVLCPVLNSYKSKLTRAVATFQKQCGSDICKPDLSVTGNLVIPGNLKEIHIGTVQEVTLVVEVKNKAGDAAYLSQVLISYPTTFDYIGPRASDLVRCTTSATRNGTETATCTVGNPLKGNSNKTFGIKFGTTELVNDFYITITAKSANEDLNKKDNEVKLKVGVKFEADLEVVGSSVPDEVIYEGKAKERSEIKTQRDIGPKIAQTIIVQNNGPSKVDGSEITINVPSQSLGDAKGYLLYMLQVELTGASGSCITKGVLNPENIPVGNITSESKESRRKRRDVTYLDCRRTTCKRFKCQLGLLLPGEKAEVTIRSRLWQSTLIRKNPGSVKIETVATVSIPDKRYTQPNTENDYVKIIINASPVSTGQAKQKTPWWVYFLAALGGVLLLAIAVGIMYKLGFFKRKRVKDISNPQTDDSLVS
ncbi:integrin alpha-9-like isoform X2 [Actinia tenebrosa]|uniref:Integrin alpha-9-like isoform X2 n=1 Tax=Actinia tenebrosa TaxID=6105 RepID=A0A6P8J7W2_ACTTE|nr:integrin alpha-9-like isoform X2 [Actinia tenebrosa]